MTTAGIVRYVFTDDAALPELELLLELELEVGLVGLVFDLEPVELANSPLQEQRMRAQPSARKRG